MKSWTTTQKRQFLGEHGVEVESLPRWQTRGFAAYFAEFEKIGFNPKTGLEARATRKKLEFDAQLPDGDEFGAWLGAHL